MDRRKERRERIDLLLARVRALNAQGVTRSSLEAVKSALIALARERDLFPLADFPALTRGLSLLYRLAQDPDQRLALYLQTALAGEDTPPHNHGTWAVIAGVVGEEENILYERLDSGDRPGHGSVKPKGRFTVKPGTAIAFMPEEVHSILLPGKEPAIHLHLYGKPLELMTDRVWFDVAKGTTAHFAAPLDIADAP
jgi:predicted metal-dependent enzyme (double-stranded beta helix superfamily)